MQHRDNEIIQLNKTPNITYSCTSKCLSQNIHWGVLVAQGTNGDLFYEKVIFTETFWSPVLKKLESFSDTFLVYELAYPRVQLGLERIVF